MVTNYGTVIHYQNGKVICEDVFRKLFYCDFPSEHVGPGDVFEMKDLTPIDQLALQEQLEIQSSLSTLSKEYWHFVREETVI